MKHVHDGNDWVELSLAPLPLDEVTRWVVRPDCGAFVLFAGTVRDHSKGRPGVVSLEYEAYDEEARRRLAAIAAEARRRWPLGRVALLHRCGRLALTEVSVVVAVSSAHRAEAFAAARWCIDTVKSTVPIWKREEWDGGVDWGTCASHVDPVPGGGR